MFTISCCNTAILSWTILRAKSTWPSLLGKISCNQRVLRNLDFTCKPMQPYWWGQGPCRQPSRKTMMPLSLRSKFHALSFLSFICWQRVFQFCLKFQFMTKICRGTLTIFNEKSLKFHLMTKLLESPRAPKGSSQYWQLGSLARIIIT